MGEGVRHFSDSNVVSLAVERQRRQQAGFAPETPGLARVTSAAAETETHAREVVLLVTGGRFECVVNGAMGMLRAGDFVRLSTNATYSVRDVGEVPGTIISHRFPPGLDGGFYRELVAALPPYTSSFPKRGSRAFAEIEAIAGRWGIVLDSGAAA